MPAATYIGNSTINIVESSQRPPAPGEVQIDVAFTGICGTDLHILHGNMDSRVTFPAIIGHEMSGRISALGEGVSGWNLGDPVTVMPLDWCGDCPACKAGHQHICQNLNFIGIDSAGSLQKQWNVPETVLVRLPDSLRLDHAALVEPVAVSVHDVRRAEIQPGEKAVVIGGGPIGVLIATSARHAGAEVVVLELDGDRRARIQELGFEVLDPQAQDQVEWVNTWTGGAGADVVFEVSGAAAAVLGATALAKVRGRLVIVAIHPQPRPVDLQRVFWRELTLVGARVYERRDFETAVELLAAGVIPADQLITGTVPLERTADAFSRLAAGDAMKILVDCQAVPA
ncbi:zinc-binding dehydrogenase [Arthrobacter sp. ok362]|uniref:zinc-dependent alcohol dehydrogenase n=1 Tax=Arthrobacter sp. ok362 TaxID=1761745 RepID=UPI0008864308|nr:alcohol dehydrogenase catalytic domain-containing protein [Arthrobacter sp. ok362]SDK58552.1 2-desacetyl-2-hydroxyethyl bacteriochlorophyllide A dehydrogenase [Arthrobacter sp. ok362]